MKEGIHNEHCILSQLKPLHTTPEEIDEMMKNCLLFLSAGYDTISHTLSSVLYFLHKYPKERILIKQEIMNVINNDLKVLTAEKLDEMHYLSYVIKEA